MAEKEGKYGGVLRNAYSYTHLGVTFAASIIAFTFLGKYLDGKLGSAPYLLLAGAFFGGGAGFYYITRELIQRSKMEEKGKGEDG